MAENLTKRALADALKALMETRPLSGITVGEICTQCQMNRKSFYYHFRDKYDLVTWIFSTDFFGTYLPEHPDDTDTLLSLCRYLEREKVFYRAALRVDGQNSFHEYLREVLRPILSVRLGPAASSGEQAEFCLAMCVGAYRESLTRWLLDSCPLSADDYVQILYHAVRSLSATIPTEKRDYD